MAGTIQRIAELAGVSRGTVDRAINGRGRVNEETAAGSVRLRMNWDMFQNTEKKERRENRQVCPDRPKQLV